MNELTIYKNNEQFPISAIELHKWVGSKQDFSAWIKYHLKLYVQDIEYSLLVMKSTGGRPRKDYMVTWSAAEEIALAQRTPQGRKCRQQIIVQRNALLKIVQAPQPVTMTRMQILQMAMDAEQEALEQKRLAQEAEQHLLIEQEARKEVEHRVEIVENKVDRLKERFVGGGDRLVRDAAKFLNFEDTNGKPLGQKGLYRILREIKWLTKYGRNHEPYQNIINNGLLARKKDWVEEFGDWVYTPTVTEKGMARLYDKLIELGYNQLD